MTMSNAADVDMLHAALAAYDAGLCVVRANVDGTKAPFGQWKRYQSERPTREQVASWFANGHAGMGVICGAVSGDLEMFELEGRFMADNGAQRFNAAMVKAGLELLMRRLINGFMVVSPSGGRHFYYRVSDGEATGNTKLAHDPDHNTIIETRGEGGFVILAPSHGPVHPSGKAWDRRNGDVGTIPTITVAEREALFEVARSFDQGDAKPVIAQPVDPGKRGRVATWQHGEIGPSWVDTVVAHLKTTWTMQALLEHYGWTYAYTDRHRRVLMTRPGKDEGVSGSINANDRLLPFSTSVPFATGGKPPTTYDHLDVIAAYEHRGSRQAAAEYIADSTGIRQQWHRERAPALPAGVAETGEVIAPDTRRLDEAFWTSRPVLAHIRQAARSRLVSPSALLGAALARAAAFTPPSTCLPDIIGSRAPLSVFIAFRGNSGAGKSSPAAAAADLLPVVPPGCVGPLALGSGEGLVEAFMELVEETDGAGKKKKVKRQVYSGALFSLDEGQALAEMATRRGSTIMPVLRTAWSGGDPGQANASIETRRSLKPGSYSVGLISLWQDKAAAALLADADGGTPQRFVWMPTDDPGASIDTPPWPGPLTWEPPAAFGMKDIISHYPMDVDDQIRREIICARVKGLHGELEEDPLDAHRRLNKLKVAGILAILDNRRSITVDDWELAEAIMRQSDDVRDWVIAEARRRQAAQLAADVERAIVKESMTERSAASRALTSAARAVFRACAKHSEARTSRRDISRAIASRDRQHVTVDDAIAEAERLKWVVGDDVRGYVCGEAKPA